MNKARDPELVTYTCPDYPHVEHQPACATLVMHPCHSKKNRGRTMPMERA